MAFNFRRKAKEVEEITEVEDEIFEETEEKSDETESVISILVENFLINSVAEKLNKNNISHEVEKLENGKGFEIFLYESDENAVRKIIEEESKGRKASLDNTISVIKSPEEKVISQEEIEKLLNKIDSKLSVEKQNPKVIMDNKTVEYRKRDRRVTLRMSEEEYARLQKKVDASGKNMNTYLIEAIEKSRVKTLKIPPVSEEFLDSLLDIKRELKAIRTSNGKSVGVMKQAIYLNEGNSFMNENDFKTLKEEIAKWEEINRRTDEKLKLFDKELRKVWQI